MDNYGIGVPMNVRCEGTIVLYHRNSIRGHTVGVFHFNHNREVWFDPEFENAGFLWCSKKSEIINIKTILKQKILTQLTYYKKHALYYMNNNKIEIVPVHNLPYYLEHQSLTIWFEPDFQ